MEGEKSKYQQRNELYDVTSSYLQQYVEMFTFTVSTAPIQMTSQQFLNAQHFSTAHRTAVDGGHRNVARFSVRPEEG